MKVISYKTIKRDYRARIAYLLKQKQYRESYRLLTEVKKQGSYRLTHQVKDTLSI